VKRTWSQFVADFIVSERKLLHGKDKNLTLHIMGLEWLGLISRQYARGCL
jgi:hypothetical protein